MNFQSQTEKFICLTFRYLIFVIHGIICTSAENLRNDVRDKNNLRMWNGNVQFMCASTWLISFWHQFRWKINLSRLRWLWTCFWWKKKTFSISANVWHSVVTNGNLLLLSFDGISRKWVPLAPGQDLLVPWIVCLLQKME